MKALSTNQITYIEGPNQITKPIPKQIQNNYKAQAQSNKHRLDIYMLGFLIQQNLDSTNNESHTFNT